LRLSLAAGLPLGKTTSASTRIAKGTSIKEIWDADQRGNGVPSILPSQTNLRSEITGYVVTDEPLNWDGDKDHVVHPDVFIPESKFSTYKLVKAIFDNYTLNQSKPETPQTDGEKAEIKAFITAIQDLDPMKLARDFIDSVKGSTMTDTEWYDMIHKIWFDIYEFKDSTPHRSGFEHVFVGEQKGSQLGGYHFWYKYYLDDQAKEGYANGEDNMRYNGSMYRNLVDQGVATPDVVTLSHYWYAVDFETEDLSTIMLSKPIGGYHVGCSAEGLLALGLVTFYDPTLDNNIVKAVINNAKYDMVLIKDGPNKSSINTFYPKFKGSVGKNNDKKVRIVAALVNPEKEDKDRETVTIINISNKAVSIEGWSIAGNNGNAYKLTEEGIKLDAGEVRTFRLPAKEAQLVNNKDGNITLSDADGTVVNTVKYFKEDVKSGVTLLF